MAFTHLHFHTSYSFLDGYNPIAKAVNRVKELNQKACAITDHNHIGGCLEFQRECVRAGIKPLLGLEGYFTTNMDEITKDIKLRKKNAIDLAIKDNKLDEKSLKKLKTKDINEIIKPYMYDTRSYHILFIAKNQKGWYNLIQIQNITAKSGKFNGRYHCDFELLKKYNEGLIVTTACIGSYSSHRIQEDNYEEAENYILKMKDIFKDDFYLEIQPLVLDKQIKTNLFYFEMAKKHDIKVIATNDVHWTLKEDYDDHDTLLCIGIGKKKYEEDRMKYSNDFWIKSEDEMIESFYNQTKDEYFNYDEKDYMKLCKEAIENTQLIVDKVEEDIKLGSDIPLFPKIDIEHNLTAEESLTIKAWKGLFEYLSKNPNLDKKVYEQRLYDELKIINEKGYAPYFLVVNEYISWSNNNDIPTGPGRGSAASSLVLFVLGITKVIDPIEHQLMFSRFLTADRTSPPDVDSDIEFTGRDRLIQHIKDYYGDEKVSHIGTYSYMGVKTAIKDVARVLNMSFVESNYITKQIDIISGEDPGITFKKLDELQNGNDSDKELYVKFQSLEKEHTELFRLARAFEGSPRGQGVHASGILVTPMPVGDMLPLRYDENNTAITLYTGTQLEELNFIKFDILGLKTLTVIKKALNFINKDLTFDDLYKKANLEDKNIYDVISKGDTDTIFQLSSNMMKGLIKDIKPNKFNDIVAITSLGRPGPLNAGSPKMYSEGKNEGKINYPIRGCEDILDSTYGNICYQEQLMLISKKVSGFNDNQADNIVRKLTAKKKVELFPMMIRCHIYGKKNCEGPEGWENNNDLPWYDPNGKYGDEIKGAVSNGYTVEEMNNYFEKVMGFAQYA